MSDCAPLVAADVDLTDFGYMPLDVRRLRDSRLAAKVDGEEFRAAVLLWCAAWHQVPAASLPDDDVELAQLAGYGRVVKEWKKVRNGALYRWTKCSDGRLYHPVIAEKANEAWQQKQLHAWKRECDRVRKENIERKKRNEPEVATPPRPTRNSTEIADGTVASSAGIPAEISLKGTEKERELNGAEEGSPRSPSSAAEAGICEIQERCASAAGVENSTAQGLKDFSPIWTLIAAGYDLDVDILPKLRACREMGKSGRSWAYYVPVIAEGKGQRAKVAPKTIVAQTIWILQDSPEWPPRAAAYRQRHGRDPPHKGGPGGLGWHFPAEMIPAFTTPSPNIPT